MTRARSALKVCVKPTEPHEIPVVIRDLRKADIQEAMACGMDPHKAVTGSVAASTAVYTIIGGGRPIGLFGVGPVELKEMPGVRVGCIWMVGTPDISRISMESLKQSRRWVNTMHNYYPVLWNWVYAANAVHVRWLKWLGFKIIGMGARGPQGLPFYQFIRVN